MASYSRQNSSRAGDNGSSSIVGAAAAAQQQKERHGASLQRTSANMRGMVSPAPFTFSSSSAHIDLAQSMINASPGCYAGDDGSIDFLDWYNFSRTASASSYFATCSLGYFDETSYFRRKIIWFIASKLFDCLVLMLIVANLIILTIADLRAVDATTGDLNA
uniref:Ion transport domain-containing protein n=1 Tax=Globisporangium ultimum (strain ATCC 200006 / CBS 805.95 / DAOM BR144) TaxID=431595 RepID=K3WPZ7_GLOUD